MDLVNQMLQVSAKLFKLLTEIPSGEERTKFIEAVNKLLNDRGKIVNMLKEDGFRYNPKDKVHSTLFELDKGIQDRLNIVFKDVKSDLKNLQISKKNETQYLNPYSSVRVMDGRYYDKKK